MDRVYGGRLTNRGRRVATAPMSLRFEPFETAEQQGGGGAWVSPSPSPCFSEGCITMVHPAGATSPSPAPLLHQIVMQTKDKEALLDEIMRLKRTLHERAFFLQRDKVHATTVRIENRKLECDIKDLEYQGSLESSRTAGGRNVRTQLKVMKVRYEEMRDICDSQHEEIALLRRDVRVLHTRELELERDALAQEIAALRKTVDGLKSIQNRLMCVQKELVTTKERADHLESTNRDLECCMEIVNKDLDRTYHDEVKSRQKMLESMSLAKRNAKQLLDLEQQTQALKASIEQEKQDKSSLGKQAEELEEQLDTVEKQLAGKGIVRPRTPNYKEVSSKVASDLASQAKELAEKEAAAREAAAKAAAAAPPTPEQLKEKEADERAAREEAAKRALAARAVAAREAAAREAAAKEAAAKKAAEEEAAEKEAAAKRAAARQAVAAAKKVAAREAAVAAREAEARMALNEATAAKEAAALKAEAMSKELQMSREEAAAKEAALAADLAAAREAAAREAAAAQAAMASLKAREIEIQFKENKDEQCQTEESYDAIMRKLKEEALMRLESVNSRASTSKSPPPSSTKLDIARKSRFEAEPGKSRIEAEPRKSRFEAEPRKSRIMADARKSKFMADVARKSKFQAAAQPQPQPQTQRKRVYITANFAEDTKQISEIRPLPAGVPNPDNPVSDKAASA